MLSLSSAPGAASTVPSAMQGSGTPGRTLAVGWHIAPRAWPLAALAIRGVVMLPWAFAFAAVLYHDSRCVTDDVNGRRIAAEAAPV